MNIILNSIKKDGQILNIIKPESNERLSFNSLEEYVYGNIVLIDQLLLKTGAILFRGFDLNKKEEFFKFKEILSGPIKFDYVDGNSPRTKLFSDIYTSTEYPNEYSISLHNELSYSNQWPKKILFFCKTPPSIGGETPIVDCRSILKRLDLDIVDRFEKYGVKYTRYLKGAKGIGKSWMDTFETSDRKVVETYCKNNNIEFSWEGDYLFLCQYGPGVTLHPTTKEKVWFNQANQFHPSGLPDDIYRGLKMLYANNTHKYPQYAFYGNGEEIPEEYLKSITDVHFDAALTFKWEQGDVLLLDNMLMAHGRMPFEGPRKIYVSMY